ncbi:hypothetical protein GGR52DRAFT_591723 [Hypoxylon sp. FL1284]|nr:hypothetical protein GGR52DRAFT_591723 [Hypoxylon sp. FL1284]
MSSSQTAATQTEEWYDFGLIRQFMERIGHEQLYKLVERIRSTSPPGTPYLCSVTEEECDATRARFVLMLDQSVSDFFRGMLPDILSGANRDSIMHAFQICLGIHKELKLSNYSDTRMGNFHMAAILKLEPKELGPPRVFHKFRQLPPELRAMIWQFAVPAQNRVVKTDGLRRVIHCPCPVLFLVCKEAKYHAAKLYQKVRKEARHGADLAKSRVIPSYYAWPGPLVSFQHDIIELGACKFWRMMSPQELGRVQQLIDRGETVRPIVRSIMGLRERRIRRIAVLADTWWKVKRPESLFYRNAAPRKFQFGTNQTTTITWPSAWADFVQEVWAREPTAYLTERPVSIARRRHHIRRLFPPEQGAGCVCSICSKADHLGSSDKPDPRDFDEHERRFAMIKPEYGCLKQMEHGYWPANVPLPVWNFRPVE